jgi:hypothetical protein
MRHANISTTMNVYGGAFMKSQAQSQHVCRPAPAGSRSNQIEKDRLVDGLFSCVQTLQDHFRPQSKIQIPCNPMIALVAGGFESATLSDYWSPKSMGLVATASLQVGQGMG